MKYPLPILIIVVFQSIVSGVALALGTGLMLLVSGWVQVFSHDLTGLTPALKGLLLLELLLSLGGSVSAYGLWRLQRWGWVGSLLFQGLAILNQGVIAMLGRAVTPMVIISVGVFGAIALWLTAPSVRTGIGSPQAAIAVAPKDPESPHTG